MSAARSLPLTLPDGNSVLVDAGLQDALVRLNAVGLRTAQSCSGLAADHRGEGSCGYIAWFTADLTEAQREAIAVAACAAGLEERQIDLFFVPGLAVYASRMKDGTPEITLRGLASDLACVEMGLSDVPWGAEFLPWLERRNGILEELSEEHGGMALRYDAQKAAAWGAFTRLLAG